MPRFNGTPPPMLPMTHPLDVQIPPNWNLERADRLIRWISTTHTTAKPMVGFMQILNPMEVSILRQATLRAHRKAISLQWVPVSIRELDDMIQGCGPNAAENLIRKAVDDKRGEVDTPTGTSNDEAFREQAKKI